MTVEQKTWTTWALPFNDLSETTVHVLDCGLDVNIVQSVSKSNLTYMQRFWNNLH